MQSSNEPSSTPAEAVQRHVDRVQRQLSCVTSAVADVGGGYYVRSEPHALTVAESNAVRLRGAARIAIDVFQAYSITGSLNDNYQVLIVGYMYSIIDGLRREMLSYQWHPDALSHVRTPHLHLGAGSLVGRDELQRAHLPTGFVELHQVLRLLIEEFQVTPLRTDWDDLLR